MRTAARRAGQIVADHSSDSASSSDGEFGEQDVPRDDGVGTQAGLGWEEESVSQARLRAEVILLKACITAEGEEVKKKWTSYPATLS